MVTIDHTVQYEITWVLPISCTTGIAYFLLYIALQRSAPETYSQIMIAAFCLALLTTTEVLPILTKILPNIAAVCHVGICEKFLLSFIESYRVLYQAEFATCDIPPQAHKLSTSILWSDGAHLSHLKSYYFNELFHWHQTYKWSPTNWAWCRSYFKTPRCFSLPKGNEDDDAGVCLHVQATLKPVLPVQCSPMNAKQVLPINFLKSKRNNHFVKSFGLMLISSLKWSFTLNRHGSEGIWHYYTKAFKY